MKRILTFLVVAAMAAACSPKEQNPYEYTAPEFKKTYKAEIVPLNTSVICSMCSSLEICEDKLILNINNADNKNVFQVFSAADGRFLRAFATAGRGDNELLDYYRMAYDSKNHIIHVIDNSSQYQQIDARKAANGDKDYIIKNDLGFSGNKTIFIQPLSNGRILHTGTQNRYFSTNADYFDTVVLCDKYPLVTALIDADTVKRKTYLQLNAKVATSPDGEKFVASTRYGMLMEAFDVSADKLTPRFVKRFYEPRLKNAYMAEEGVAWGTCSIKATNKYIYVMYSPTKWNDAKNIRLGVFDWTGKSVACYEFGDQIVHNYTVTPDDKRAYCWVQNADGEEYLGYFDLK
ncbi:MAG: hypothetical protein IKL17_04915 [Alistipes sp.]|nr:hypothetical protein [Alistipes sp.]